MSNPTEVEKNKSNFNPFNGPEVLRVLHTTKSQGEIWIACKLGGKNANRAYNESISLDLKGEFNKQALEKAIETLINRHESLRCIFSSNGEFITILKELNTPIDFIDISPLSEEEKKNTLSRYAKKEAEYIFDLIKGPLIRFSILKTKNNHHRFTITSHHIICDGWSISIMLQELGIFYSAYVLDKTPVISVPESFITYADEKLELIESEEYKKIEQFWIDQYKDSVPKLLLPTDAPYPTLRNYKSKRLDLPLNENLLAKIKKVGLNSNCSLVTTLLAVFDIFLFKITNQHDIVVGLPSSGQSASGMTQLVGHCVNLLPLRTKLDTKQSFIDYLKQKNSNLFDAYDHQELSFGHLLQKLSIPRDPSRVPLVPVVFNIDLGMDNGVSFQNLSHKLISNPRNYEIFEIFINASGSDNNLVFEWSYNKTLFKSDTIKQMMISFESIIEKLIYNSNKPIGEIISEDYINNYNILNNTVVNYPNESLYELLKKQAIAEPDRIAVEFHHTKLTYEALHKKTNQLAHYFKNQGVESGDFIGVALSRNIDLITTILAILQCGAAYLPLDPEYPKSRLEFMLNDSSCKFLITNNKFSSSFPNAINQLLIEDALINSQEFPNTPLSIFVSQDNLAYLLYTSGSTGKPKGVKVTHKNLVNFLNSMALQPGINKNDRLLSITTISFDIAGLELFLPLLKGATLILCDEDTTKDGRLLLDLLRKKDISILQATPTTWKMLLDLDWIKPLPLKALCGGEALTLNLAQRLLSKCDSLWNMYGPTETTIWSATKQVLIDDNLITIGKPIANTQLYIIDENCKLLPPGSIGEIGISGDGVSLGYLNRLELTSEKFISHPFSTKNIDTLYRTGDLGKLLPNGEIQCLGRTDQQVKIRGHRIELGDIETALSSLNEIKDAVVTANTETLTAHVVTNKKINNDIIKHWRSNLKELLPSHLIPHEFNLLDALPTTLNGKVDRKALIKPEEQKNKKFHYTPPRTKAEQIVSDIWESCLNIEKIDIFSNFFELGGHSLIAVKVMALLEKQTGKRLPLSSLFEYSTVEKLAQLLNLDNRFITWDSLVPIKREGSKTPLYIVHGAGMNVLIFNALAKNLDNDQPVYGLQAKGLNGIDKPFATVEEIAAHYIKAIVKDNPNGPYAIAGYSFGGIIAYEMVRQMMSKNKKVTMLAMLDTYVHPSYYYSTTIHKKMASLSYNLKSYFYVLYHMFASWEHSKKRINTKIQRIKNLYLTIKNGKKKQHEIIYNQPYELDRMNNIASRKYYLKPQNIKIDLFRVEDELYYVHDRELLGWKNIALNGVEVHTIPGDHVELFSPPNDKKSALILQDILDQRHADF